VLFDIPYFEIQNDTRSPHPHVGTSHLELKAWRLPHCAEEACNGKREVQSQQTRPDHLKSSQKSSQILVVKQ
jgi:hypothetical protein